MKDETHTTTKCVNRSLHFYLGHVFFSPLNWTKTHTRDILLFKWAPCLVSWRVRKNQKFLSFPPLSFQIWSVNVEVTCLCHQDNWKYSVQKGSFQSAAVLYYLSSSILPLPLHKVPTFLSCVCTFTQEMQPLPSPLIVLEFSNNEVCDLILLKVVRLNAAYVHIYSIWFPLLFPIPLYAC